MTQRQGVTSPTPTVETPTAHQAGTPGAPLVAVLGPTGSGKSSVAMQAAQATGAAIVAVDAFTVYRGMDIGTAKPTQADQALVPHYMVDQLNPDEDGTVVWFQQTCRNVIAELQAAGTPTLLVGGSVLYARAITEQLDFPPTDQAVRDRIIAELQADIVGGYAKLQQLDPVGASKMEHNNIRRIARALEVIELTGNPFSSFATVWTDYRSIYPNLQLFGLDISRETLRERVSARTQIMLDEGWLDECARLLEQPMSDTAAQAHGYKELFAYLKGEWTLQEAVEQTINRTRQYAARQQRGFAKDPRIRWAEPKDLLPALITALTPTDE